MLQPEARQLLLDDLAYVRCCQGSGVVDLLVGFGKRVRRPHEGSAESGADDRAAAGSLGLDRGLVGLGGRAGLGTAAALGELVSARILFCHRVLVIDAVPCKIT
jgi:hypothetical protein